MTTKLKLTKSQVLGLAYAYINGDGIYSPEFGDDDSGRIHQGAGVSVTTINSLDQLGLVKVQHRQAYSSIGGRRDKHAKTSRRMSSTWEAELTPAGLHEISARYTMAECRRLVTNDVVARANRSLAQSRRNRAK